jgi:hypothetical protein
LRKTREDLFAWVLTITTQEGTLQCHAIEVACMEKELAPGRSVWQMLGSRNWPPQARWWRSSELHGRSKKRRSGTSWARLNRH